MPLVVLWCFYYCSKGDCREVNTRKQKLCVTRQIFSPIQPLSYERPFTFSYLFPLYSRTPSDANKQLGNAKYVRVEC